MQSNNTYEKRVTVRNEEGSSNGAELQCESNVKIIPVKDHLQNLSEGATLRGNELIERGLEGPDTTIVDIESLPPGVRGAGGGMGEGIIGGVGRANDCGRPGSATIPLGRRRENATQPARPTTGKSSASSLARPSSTIAGKGNAAVEAPRDDESECQGANSDDNEKADNKGEQEGGFGGISNHRATLPARGFVVKLDHRKPGGPTYRGKPNKGPSLGRVAAVSVNWQKGQRVVLMTGHRVEGVSAPCGWKPAVGGAKRSQETEEKRGRDPTLAVRLG
ncbi:hypothetical protein EDB87DRAFT_1581620 [Lactarius vividus]|nr:hypothetical protein EDB87DRAFT_1581620 [Lactarius vividus]